MLQISVPFIHFRLFALKFVKNPLSLQLFKLKFRDLFVQLFALSLIVCVLLRQPRNLLLHQLILLYHRLVHACSANQTTHRGPIAVQVETISDRVRSNIGPKNARKLPTFSCVLCRSKSLLIVHLD